MVTYGKYGSYPTRPRPFEFLAAIVLPETKYKGYTITRYEEIHGDKRTFGYVIFNEHRALIAAKSHLRSKTACLRKAKEAVNRYITDRTHEVYDDTEGRS